MICPSHGLVWKNPAKVIELYDKWSKYEDEKGVVVIYASMYGNTAQMADYIGNLIGSKGNPVRTFDVSKTHVSYLLSEIWKYKGLVLGTCAYNTKMHPMMEHLCNEIDLSQPNGKKVALFGTSSWNGAGVKGLKKFVEEYAGFEMVSPIVETFGSVSPEKVDSDINAMVEELVSKL
jgi:flavorubredoxin